MSDFEPMGVIEKPTPVTITLQPETIVGLHALLHWLKGFEAGGGGTHGRTPGHFELVMHYRAITAALRQLARDGGADDPTV